MTNATSNSKRHKKLIPHYNAQLRWLHLRMGQELSHKSVFPSMPSHSLFVSAISQKIALRASGMSGECPLHPAATAGAACPNSRATPSTHKWPQFGRILRRWKWRGALQSRHQDFPHLPCQRAPEPIVLHGAISRPPDLHTRDTTFPEELAKRRGIISKHTISTFFKITALVWLHSQATLTCPTTLLPPANFQGVTPACTGLCSKQ